MRHDIVEEGQPMGDAAATIEKKARQLVYDSRYEVKRMLAGKKVDAVAQERMVLQRIGKSTAIPAVKARARQMLTKKAGPVKEDYISQIQETATDNVANALFKVFVEGVQKPEVKNEYLEELASAADKKYKIRVTDPKTGNSYVRYATREKITQLRAQGLKVELTEYGEPREGERKRGEDTARATGGGKSKKDYDGDGKVESSSKEHAGAVHNAIQRATGGTPDGKDTRKEDYLWTEAKKSKKPAPEETTGVDNYASGAVKMFPNDSEKKSGVMNAGFEMDGPVLSEKAMSKAQQRFMGMVYAAKKGEEPASPEVAQAAAGMSKAEAKKFAKTKHKGLPEKKGKKKSKKSKMSESVESQTQNRDARGDYAFRNVLKNKLRSAMGVKNPMVLMDPEKLEKDFGKVATADNIKTACEGRMHDEPGESDKNPAVKAHNRKVGYKKPARRPGPKEGRDFGGYDQPSGSLGGELQGRGS